MAVLYRPQVNPLTRDKDRDKKDMDTSLEDSSQLSLADELGALAEQLARGAGLFLLQRLRQVSGPHGSLLQVAHKSTETDLVTEIDLAVESWLVQQLTHYRPGDSVLAEEGGPRLLVAPASLAEHVVNPVQLPSAVRWVIDPIDGTVNFVHAISRYAISIAAQIDGMTVAGCVHNPQTGQMYRAVRGRGAQLHSYRPALLVDSEADSDDAIIDARPLRGPAIVRGLSTAVVATGFGYDARRRARQAAVVAQLLSVVADIRRMGAASLDLCAVADGEADAYFEAGLSPWDYAAGALIASEAGCVVTGLRGQSYSSTMTVASSPTIASDLCGWLAQSHADEV